MNDSAAWLDPDVAIRRYAAGWTVLIVTVLLSNVFGFLEHPERVFDVQANSAVLERVHLLGFAGQVLFGCWLGLALILEVRPARRLCQVLWLASVAAFFAPMPSATKDIWLAPLLFVVAALVLLLSRAIDAALLPHAG